MKTPARRYQLVLLFALLALSGLTIHAHWTGWAHRLLKITQRGNTPSVQRAARGSGKPVSANTVKQPTGAATTETSQPLETALEPAQSGGSFNLTQTVIPGGGGVSAGGSQGLTGSAGQSVVGASSGGSFSVSGGFWNGGGACPAITVNPNTLPNGQLSAPYSQQLMQTGGAGAITWSTSAGSLPNNVSLNAATGLLSGTPTASGTFTFSARATDANGCFGERGYMVTIGTCPTITLNPNTLPGGTVGTAYNQTLTASNGTPAYSFTLNTGSLPTGITLAAGGALGGTPSAAGAFNFTIKVTDSAGCMALQSYTVVICATITVNPASLPNGFAGTAYNQSFTQTGGNGNITWSVSAGALPGGLTLNAATGALTGTPAAAGSFSFTIRATDANACTGTRSYSVIISGSGLQFYPLAHPVRLLDTRPGAAGCYMPNAAITGGTSRLQLARGLCDGLTIPNNALAITGNITTVESGGGYLTLYPSDAAQPLVANSNYNSNEVLNNVFTVGLGNADGAFKIFVTSTTNVVIDVTGYYAPPTVGGLFFHPLPKPIRLLETRAGQTGCTTPGVPLPGGVDTPQQARLTCDGVTIPSTALAIVGNATTVNPGGGYLTLFPADAARPLVASSNYLPGQVMNAPFTVGLSAAGEFKIYPTSQTDLVIDVLGYYSADANDANGAGLLFNALPHPVRLLETRAGFGGCSMPGAPLAGGSTRTQAARGLCDGVTIAADALGIVGNATVVNSNGGYLTFWPSTAAQPLVATSNFTVGQVFNRHFTVGLGAGDGAFKIFTFFTTDLVIDVSGYFAP